MDYNDVLVLTLPRPIEYLLKPASPSFRSTASLYLLPVFTPTCTVRPKFNSLKLPRLPHRPMVIVHCVQPQQGMKQSIWYLRPSVSKAQKGKEKVKKQIEVAHPRSRPRNSSGSSIAVNQ